jgi:hypothetical protein
MCPVRTIGCRQSAECRSDHAPRSRARLRRRWLKPLLAFTHVAGKTREKRLPVRGRPTRRCTRHGAVCWHGGFAASIRATLRIALVAREGAAPGERQSPLGRRSTSAYRPSQPTVLRERVPANTNSPAATSGVRTLSLNAALASTTHLAEETGAHLPGFVPGKAQRGSATGAQQGRGSIPLSQICSIARCASGVTLPSLRAARAGGAGRARKASAVSAHQRAPCVSGPPPPI